MASYYDPLLRKQNRIEHRDNAFVTGKLAEQNMTGEYGIFSPIFQISPQWLLL